MTDREIAIQTLVQARDILGERLVERLVESRDQVLEDAIGGVYESEINSIFEQIAGRLSQVNQMLANMPEDRAALVESADDADGYQQPEAPATPTMDIYDEPLLAAETLRHHVKAGNRQEAAEFLSRLFSIDSASAIRCAEFFFERCSAESDTLDKTQALIDAVRRAHRNDALFALSTCFGLSGNDLIQSFASLESGLKSSAARITR